MTNKYFIPEERISDISKINEPLQSFIGLESYNIFRSFKDNSSWGWTLRNFFSIDPQIHAEDIKNIICTFKKEIEQQNCFIVCLTKVKNTYWENDKNVFLACLFFEEKTTYTY